MREELSSKSSADNIMKRCSIEPLSCLFAPTDLKTALCTTKLEHQLPRVQCMQMLSMTSAVHTPAWAIAGIKLCETMGRAWVSYCCNARKCNKSPTLYAMQICLSCCRHQALCYNGTGVGKLALQCTQVQLFNFVYCANVLELLQAPSSVSQQEQPGPASFAMHVNAMTLQLCMRHKSALAVAGTKQCVSMGKARIR